ncbi:MAG: tyrosine-type recombinase/integrase, partial [Acidimicrobiia bacterium]
MASIDKRPNGKWRARWREYPGAPQHARHFDRKVDAERFLVEVQHKIARGDYTNPSEGLVTLAQFSTEYLRRRTWRPATRERVDVSLRTYVLPTFGPWPLNRIRRAHIEEWAAGLKLAPSSVGAVVLVLSGLLEAAVKDGRISRNPARGAVLPKIERAPLVPLTVPQVQLLTDAMPAHLRAGVFVAATTGLRQGELAGLTVDRLHLLERSMRIDQQLWTPRNAKPELVAPKNQRSYRTIALA